MSYARSDVRQNRNNRPPPSDNLSNGPTPGKLGPFLQQVLMAQQTPKFVVHSKKPDVSVDKDFDVSPGA